MKKSILFSGIAVLLSWATGIINASAQDNDKPWHVIAYDSDTIEIASFNVEALEDMALSPDGATVTFTLDNGKAYPYPAATTLFGFEPRSEGSGTASEAVEANSWSVSYAHGILHLSDAPADVRLYGISGVRVGTFAGERTIAVNLASGFYIVQSGRNTAKLFVSPNGTGGATAAPQRIATRAAEAFKIWINIVHGDAGQELKTSFQMDMIYYLKFTPEGLEIVMKDGNLIKIPDFKGMGFDITPSPQQTSEWDMEKTLKFGGASYGMNWLLPNGQDVLVKYLSVVHKNGVIIYDAQNNQYIKIPNSGINPKVWTEYDEDERYPRVDNNARLSVYTNDEGVVRPCITYKAFEKIFNSNGIFFIMLSSARFIAEVAEKSYEFNGHTNIIPSNITQNADGSIAVETTGADGVTFSHIFKGW